MIGKIILGVIGIIAAFEGLILLLFPKFAINLCKEIGKWQIKKWRKIALLEFLIGMIIILLLVFL
jgi:uncharacterized protein YjeT (DUF2065 family)